MPKYQHTDSVEYLNTTTWLKGSHGVKFGTDIIAPMMNEYVDIPSTRGNVTFSGQFTGNAIADFLLGYARGAELSNVFVVNQRRHAYAFFVQDDDDREHPEGEGRTALPRRCGWRCPGR
ncbi:MAG: hypothetical protein ACRD2A_18205 [Vicinamibacterales bacterium]